MLKTYYIPHHGKDNHNYTALHLAAFTDNVTICKTLLQQGWIVAAKDKAGATPLNIAAGKGFTNIVQMFCTSKNDIIDKVDTKHKTALFYAILGGQAHTLNVMISELGLDKMAGDVLDRTVLQAAAYCGFAACAQKLIDHGVKINAIRRDEKTPLHVACSRGKEDVVHLLIKFGAMVNPYSRIDEITPLNYTMTNNHTELIQLLKERNAIHRYGFKKQQRLLGLLSGSSIQFPEQTSKNFSRFPGLCIHMNDNLLLTPIRNRRSTDSHFYEDGF
uniref:Inversin (inferred by orthology to a human protein) n=1 Tax=Strongyloides venezuelensis TaxID=75913 RepID=A0A0K0FYT1_STRVS